MGNCCGGTASNDNNVNRNKARREQTWIATGTISLRDSKLKACRRSTLTSELHGCWVQKFCLIKDGLDVDALCITQELPSRIWAVGGAAKTLDATNNQLTVLPAEISSFTNLQRLILASNRLSALPVQMSALVALKVGVIATLHNSQVLRCINVTL